MIAKTRGIRIGRVRRVGRVVAAPETAVASPETAVAASEATAVGTAKSAGAVRRIRAKAGVIVLILVVRILAVRVVFTQSILQIVGGLLLRVVDELPFGIVSLLVNDFDTASLGSARDTCD